MSPEAVDYLTTAEQILSDAEIIFRADRYAVVTREAYLAMLSAARAVIFDKTAMAPKTHSGTRAELFRLIHEGLAFDPVLAALLATGFETKNKVDYGPRPIIQEQTARQALEQARAFVTEAKKICD